jgi:acetyltransferase-like isoleucine patch superfamily enzyme
MFDFLAFITKKKYWKLHSWIIKKIMQSYGIKVGHNFYIEGTPRLKIRGKASNIVLGDNVSIFGNIDLRNRENGKIIIGDSVSIDNDCRFVAANNASLSIGDRTGIALFCVINGGADITIGSDCLISGMTYIQASDHGIEADILIREQRHSYGEIIIGSDVLLSANVAILKGATLGDGCVVGAKAVVKAGTYEKNSILAGVPAKVIKKR